MHELDVSRPDDIKQRTYKSRPPPPRRGVHWTHDEDRGRYSQQTARNQVVEANSRLAEPATATVLDIAKNSNGKEDTFLVGDKTLVNETTSAYQTKNTSLDLNQNGNKFAEFSGYTGQNKITDRGTGNAVNQKSPVKEEQEEEELVCVELEESGEVIKVDSKFLEPVSAFKCFLLYWTSLSVFVIANLLVYFFTHVTLNLSDFYQSVHAHWILKVC